MRYATLTKHLLQGESLHNFSDIELTFLLQVGLDVNRRTYENNNTLLQILCSQRSDHSCENEWVRIDKLIMLLLNTGHCDIDCTNYQGQTALWCILIPRGYNYVGVVPTLLVTQLLKAGATFGSLMDAEVRVVFLRTGPEVKNALRKVVSDVDLVLNSDEIPWEVILDRLIYGKRRQLQTSLNRNS